MFLCSCAISVVIWKWAVSIGELNVIVEHSKIAKSNWNARKKQNRQNSAINYNWKVKNNRNQYRINKIASISVFLCFKGKWMWSEQKQKKTHTKNRLGKKIITYIAKSKSSTWTWSTSLALNIVDKSQEIATNPMPVYLCIVLALIHIANKQTNKQCELHLQRMPAYRKNNVESV